MHMDTNGGAVLTKAETIALTKLLQQAFSLRDGQLISTLCAGASLIECIDPVNAARILILAEELAEAQN